MELHLRGKVAVITGGGTGIGRAAAVEFAKEGVLVAAVGRRPGPLQELAEEFRENDWPFYWEACDVADRRGMEAFAGHVFKQFGALDIWMNNAGIAIDKPLMQFTDEDWNRMMATNLQAVYDGIRLWNNVGVDFVLKKIPGKAHKTVDILIKLAVMVCLVTVICLSIAVYPKVGMKQISATLRIPMFYAQLGIIVGFILCCLQLVGRIIIDVTGGNQL